MYINAHILITTFYTFSMFWKRSLFYLTITADRTPHPGAVNCNLGERMMANNGGCPDGNDGVAWNSFPLNFSEELQKTLKLRVFLLSLSGAVLLHPFL